ncbi:hypothetical protein HMPREF9318_00071 [Streptococcus urinalis FB127-CNA-2]|uniref:Uncharacterized protein n=1 Tax=Streptococcus urinalis 2285-97 TaxID=764291 RepID=G5KEH7_9STRE|nr:hypothetical protein [Streptococcus urinalis]QBX22135.1 hypothetical protein Javan637_0027 [Streptococcus phage Javan637]QBX31591.1 hypothetical protein Javan642_0027 [Streptococcus phage Javan642]QBX31664.1 hypothetical protein Javan648_0038 [Streptococcus phage Javan648]EHJ57193.1 hypothetical protein STRUR_0811 [Streptococcus urinalis 2285-97]EKS21873.1 hypothetical protein HMPREF9318_00071 [Streptococcus urinalis FB127-CNA-2]
MADRYRQRLYAIYDDEVFIDVGTKKELSERLGIKEKTITFLSSPTYKKRNHKREAVFIGYEDEI